VYGLGWQKRRLSGVQKFRETWKPDDKGLERFQDKATKTKGAP
jgi:hypothetical protein